MIKEGTDLYKELKDCDISLYKNLQNSPPALNNKMIVENNKNSPIVKVKKKFENSEFVKMLDDSMITD